MDAESRAAPEVFAVDWRGHPCRRRHGGMRAAVFILGVQAFQIITLASVGSNLITYVFGELHFPLSQAANVVTNFVGTAFLISLFGGFLSDSYLGCFWTLLTFGVIELSGLVLLSVLANLPRFKSAPCNILTMEGSCEQARGTKATIFFLALYLIALGNGCVMPNMTAYGADQFAGTGTAAESKRLSTYFNVSYFVYCMAEIVALTAVIWAQMHFGMGIGFGVSAATMAIALISLVSGAMLYRNKPPKGSIFTPIAWVFVAALTKRNKQICPASSPNPFNPGASDAMTIDGTFRHANKFRFLDNACIGPVPSGPAAALEDTVKRPCTMFEVQQAKTLLAVLPIFVCTIITNTVLAQLQTFSVQQGYAMDTRLVSSSSFHVPPASLQSIPYAILLLLVPAYEILLVPLMRKVTGTRSGITPLQRIGVGLFIVSLSMVSAAIVERRRRHAAVDNGKLLSIMWLVPQFLIFGVSEMFTNVGLMEFFYKEASAGMQAFLTALFYSSFSFGFFLSSVLVALVNRITARDGGKGWLGDNNLNNDRLDLFYWTLAVLSGINFFCYLFCARWYNSGGGGSDAEKEIPEELRNVERT
ncbi:hypothetical protein PR202_gb28583 [Eleusine coracana subsp. coracana]|uniref:Protein NRT1/ PTR FAMILY 4.3 n=1 Tax=Eleusine coracana subsp. coracana TaxID=191504 RepID=A0AAV5FXW6_ELECO|nr:hypothetical protein PR202_gb28583 [Eleusine coracana subsp. coracana]